MLGEVLNGVIGPIFETTWNVVKKHYYAGLKDTDLKQKHIQTRQAIEQASRAYHQKYLDRHCNIKVLPGLMKEAMPMDTIYTAVKFLGQSELKYFSTLDALEELYRQSNKRRLRVGTNKRQDGLKVANEEQYLMVLGGPGVGKSTFLRKLGLEALKGNLAYDLMPVFLELKTLKSKRQTIYQAIVKELAIAGFPGPKMIMKSMLSAGKMLILLDGLDEVPSDQEDVVIEQIRNLCDSYSNNRFVTSCRIAAYRGGFNRFTDVTMAEFDDEQIEQFIYRWFSSRLDIEEGTAERFWEILRETENSAAKELAQTPLLLTFLCLVYDRSQNLPSVRSTLYGDALNILLKDWGAEKRLERDPIYQGFHADLEKELLSEIAYKSFLENQLFFSKDEITSRIATFLADTLDAPKYLDGANVLKAIEVQQGVLVERVTDAYSFSHLTLQEYLTARQISSRWMIDELVDQYLTDERWREVFLLVSGLIGSRSYELWLAMEKQSNKFLDLPKLQALLRWATARSSISDNRGLAARGRFLSSALMFASAKVGTIRSAQASANAKAIDRAINSSIALTQTISKASIDARMISIDTAGVRAIDSASALMKSIANSSSNASANARSLISARAIAIDRVIDSAQAIDKAISNANISDINFQVLACELDKLAQYIPSATAAASLWTQFSERLTDTYLKALLLDRELITLASEEAETLEKYFYSIKLIIDCKTSAVRVSRKQWETLELRLLSVPSC